MQLALIPPVSLLERVPNTGYHLVLAHLLHLSPEYRSFYQQVSGFKILDNGAAEGSVVSPELLVEVAHDIHADEVVVPDVMGDFRATFANAVKFGDLATANPSFNYVGVLQGHSAGEVLACARGMASLGYFTTLALPRHLLSLHHHERHFLAGALLQLEEVGDLALDIHCLGAGSFMREPAILSDCYNVRGMDTSLPIYMGMMGFDLRTERTYYRRPPNYFSLELEDEQMMEVIDVNIRTYASWAATPLSYV